jgi:hypothetical protein
MGTKVCKAMVYVLPLKGEGLNEILQDSVLPVPRGDADVRT